MKDLRLLLPPGIGDVHWIALKLQDWLKKRNATATVSILNMEPNRKRGVGFMELVPFVKLAGYHNMSFSQVVSQFRMGINDTPDLVPDIFDHDYFICFNRHLRSGLPLEDALEGSAIDWHYPIIEPLSEVSYREQFAKKHGPYVLFYFSDFGMHKNWTRHFAQPTVGETLATFRRDFPNLTPVLVGMKMDEPFVAPYRGGAVDLLSQTTVAQLVSLIRGAQAIVGFHNGPTLIAPHLGTRTVMLWCKSWFLQPPFRWNWLDPAKKHLYVPLEVEDIKNDPSAIMEALRKLRIESA